MDSLQERVKKKPPLSSHCTSPLTYNNVRKALLLPSIKQHIARNNPCRSEFQEMSLALDIDHVDHSDPTRLQRLLLTRLVVGEAPLESLEFKQAIYTGARVYDAQVRTVLSSMNIKSLAPPAEVLLKNAQLKILYMKKAFFEEAVALTSSQSVTSGSWWRRTKNCIEFRRPGFSMMAGENLWVIKQEGVVTLTSRDHLVMMSDLASQRYIAAMMSILYHHHQIQDVPTLSELLQIFDIGDRMLEQGGNSAYKLVYTHESSCVSRLVGDYEGGLWENSSFRLRIEEDIMTEATAKDLVELAVQKEQLLSQIFSRNVHALSQVYGLYRIWGHPTLEPLLGVNALQAIGSTPRLYDLIRSTHIVNKFKEDFIIRYINRHKEWPDLDLTKLGTYNVIRIHYERQLHYPLNDSKYKRSHLNLVSFKKIFPVDPKLDLIEFIDDKALSLNYYDLIREITLRKTIGNSLLRSLLLRFLEADFSDPEDFLKMIDEEGFPEDENVAGVHEKEREGKEKARLFGLLTLLKRTYIVLTEKLIATHIFPFYPEITMTDDELSLEKKRTNFTRSTKKTVYASLDFMKWNTNMRDVETEDFFRTIDEMFGFKNCFLRTHSLFYDSFLYLIDGSYLPTPTPDGLEEDIGCWKHHLGGIEGLRQKGWTLWTVCLLRLVMENFTCSVKIMGQGDNQMLCLEYAEDTPDAVVTDQTKRFMAALFDFLAIVGPPLKTEETWISSDLFLYGKYPIHKGVPLSMSMKKACRMFRGCNEDYPTIESSISSLAANLFAAVASDSHSQMLYLIYLIELIGLYQIHFRRPYMQSESFSKLIQMNPRFFVKTSSQSGKQVTCPQILSAQKTLQEDKLYVGLCMCPRTLGGYPIVMYASLLIKGFPDQLSYDIATLKVIQRLNPIDNNLIQNILQPFLSDDLNYDLLIMNPEAINLEATPSPAEARRAAMIEFLQKTPRVRQPYVREFLNIVNRPDMANLITLLMQPDTVHPRIINAFIQATPQYRAQQVVGKLQKTPTIAKLYMSEGEKDLYQLLAKSELTHLKSVMRCIFQEPGRLSVDLRDECSVVHASVLRDIGWKKHIIGVDCAPPHESFTFEMVDIKSPCNVDLELEKGYITIRVVTDDQITQDSTQIGPVFPYRGSVTKNKTISLATKIKAQTPSLLQKVLVIAEMENWVFQPGSFLSIVGRQLVSNVTDLPYEMMTPDLDQVSGAPQHRMRTDRIDNGGVCSVLPTQATKLQLDTSSLTYLCKGSKNKNFMFQGPLVMSLMVLGEAFLNYSELPPDSKLIHVHIKDSRSIIDLCEEPPNYNGISGSLLSYSNKESPYLYFKKEKIEQYISLALRFPPATALEREISPLPERYHSLLAYDSLNLLDPWTWTSGQEPRLISSGVTINWALNMDLMSYLHKLASILIGCFINVERVLQPDKYLNRCLAIVRTSPIQAWANLVNISFNPGFPHEILCDLHMMNPVTDEITTPTSVARVIKSAIVRIIINFITDPKWFKGRLTSLWAPPHVAPSLHPLRIVETISQLSERKMTDNSRMIQVKGVIEAKRTGLNSKPIQLLICHGSQDDVELVTVGISSESLDHTCKLIPQIDRPLKDNREIPIINLEELIPEYDTLFSLTNVPPIVERVKTVVSDLLQSDSVLRHRDYEMYLYRSAPLPTSGSYKIMSLIAGTDLSSHSNVACLADGTGGFSRVFCQVHTSAKVLYNTLIKSGEYIPQQQPIQNVPDLSDLPPEQQSKLIGLDTVNNFPSDITTDGFPEMIYEITNTRFSLVTGDAESVSMYDPAYVHKIFKGYRNFCLVNGSTMGIFKIHSTDIKDICIVTALMASYFSNIKIKRSRFSLRSSTELYLVCTVPWDHPAPVTTTHDNPGHTTTLPLSVRLILSKEVTRKLSKAARRPLTNLRASHLSFTMFITNHLTGHDLCCMLQITYPWLDTEHFPPKQVQVKFPNIILVWIHSVHRFKSSGLQSTSSKLRKENFDIQEIVAVIQSYLFMIISHEHPATWNLLIPRLLDRGVLIWYELENGGWKFLFTSGKIPSPEELRRTRVYPVSQYLSHVHMQRICRQVGLAKILGMAEIQHVSKNGILQAFTQSAHKNHLPWNNPLNPHIRDIIMNKQPEAYIEYWNIQANFLKRQQSRIMKQPS